MEDKNKDARDVRKDEPQPDHTEDSPQKNLLEERGNSEKDSGQKDDDSSSPAEDEDKGEIKEGEKQVPGANHVLHEERPEHKLFDTSGQDTNE